MHLTNLLNDKYYDLTNTEKEILIFIVNNVEKITKMSVKELSEATYVSRSSIIRLSQKLGFSGFSELKFVLKQQISDNNKIETMSALKYLEEDIFYTLKLFENSNIQEIISCMHNSKTIYLFGTGWGENRAMEALYRNLLSCKVNATIFPSVTELNWNIDNIDKQDIVFVASFTGSTPDLFPALKKIKLKKTKIVSLTPFHRNALSGLSDYNLYYGLTNLKIDEKPYKEFNYFTTLEVLIDCIFRSFLDSIEN